MWKNYLTVALRHLRRGRTFTVINGAGLALGLAACLLILLYVEDERSFDRFHTNADRIVRLTQQDVAVTPAPLAPALAESYPSVQTYVRILPTLGDVLIRNTSEDRFYESRFYWADSTLFDVFSFTLVRGDPRRALADVNSLVISEDMARKYFGEADPIGQTLIFDVGFQAEMYVSGVMRNPPTNAHFRPDFLAAMATFESYGMLDFDDWSHALYHSYVLLDQPPSGVSLAASLPTFITQQPTEPGVTYQLQRLPDIHLHSKLPDELEPAGSLTNVYSFAAIAVLILLIACINFTNLSTARSAHRAREIGMRKVLGAHRSALIVQLLGESVLLTLFALGLALPLAYFLLPVFNTLADKTLTLQTLNIPLSLLLLTGLVGVLAGSYPAFILTRFTPVRTLRGRPAPKTSGPAVRQVLVVGQFVIGIVLIIVTLVIAGQLRFIRAKNLGFQTEQTVIVSARMYGHAMTPLPFEAMQQAFATHPAVRQVAVTGDVPGTNPRQSSFFLEGMTDREAMTETNWNFYSVDYDFIEAMGLEIIDGRSFSRDVPADLSDAFLINEAALRAAREMPGVTWDTPIDKKIDRYLRLQSQWIPGKRGRVIGVVHDFHYQSLHHQIAPLVLQLNPRTRDHYE